MKHGIWNQQTKKHTLVQWCHVKFTKSVNRYSSNNRIVGYVLYDYVIEGE